MDYYDQHDINGVGCFVSTVVVVVIMAALLWIISSQMIEPTEKNIEMLRNSPDGVGGREPFLREIGDTMELEFVKHIENSEYEIAWENHNGEIVWANTAYDLNGYVRVVNEDDLEKSYIERRVNNLDIDEKGIFGGRFRYVELDSNSYTIYVAKGALQGGTTSREDCGKNCTRDVQTEVIGK